MQKKGFSVLLLSCFVMINVSFSQLCQGSLGDPIVNTTFGAGSNPGAPLLAAATTYQYLAADCPNDGFYAVRNNTTSCFSNSWHSLTSDHTGNPNGYFMLINATFQPGAFYLDTVRGLCGNSTYEFAAWIMNILLPSSCNASGIQPNLTFSIERTDGTVLQTYNSGNISTTALPSWKQYGFFFTTPSAGSDIVLRIVNNAQGGCGNDVALDDITFRPCGPLLTTSITGKPTNTATLCEGIGGNFTFTATVSGGFNNPTYQWQERQNTGTWSDIPGQTNTTLSRNFPAATPLGVYEYRLAVAEAGNMGSQLCRINSLPLSIEVVTNPVTTANNNGPTCEKNTLTLTATGGTQYTWTGPNGYTGSGSPLQLENIQLSQSGKYYVTVSNAAGCINRDSTIIAIEPAPLASTTFTNATICKADSIQLNGSGGTTYLWTPPQGLSDVTISSPKASPASTTIYQLIVTNQFTCRDTTSVTINVVTNPLADAGPDKVILKGQTIQLSATVAGTGNTYSWSPPVHINDIYALQPYVDPPADTKYILRAVSASGCGTSSDTILVKVYNDIFIPNAFTPNDDGKNDTWNITALEAFQNFELFVYNRYGQLIFHTRRNPVAWDGTYQGKPCVNGVYTYIIRMSDAKDVFKGTVMIIR